MQLKALVMNRCFFTEECYYFFCDDELITFMREMCSKFSKTTINA